MTVFKVGDIVCCASEEQRSNGISIRGRITAITDVNGRALFTVKDIGWGQHVSHWAEELLPFGEDKP